MSANPEHFRILAVGGGPAGIALAIEAQANGVNASDILVAEKGPQPIEAIRRFYPDKKMTIANYKGLPPETIGRIPTFPDLTKAETLTYFDELLSKHSVNIRMNSEVSKVEKRNGKFEVRINQSLVTADSVAIGIGILGRPNKPEYKIPSSLKGKILFDLTSEKFSGENVLVVGGGDTSSEYCQILVDENPRVTLAVRSNLKKMMDQNLKAIESLSSKARLRLLMPIGIKEILDRDSKPQVVFDDSSKMEPEVFDRVIFSIGGTTPLNFLKTCGIECENNWPKHGPSGETSVPGLYLIGDLAVGKTGGSIITAYNSAFRTAEAIFNK